jgi:hypothetical protein
VSPLCRPFTEIDRVPRNTAKSTSLTFRLLHKTSLPLVRDTCIGEVSTTIEELLGLHGNDGESTFFTVDWVCALPFGLIAVKLDLKYEGTSSGTLFVTLSKSSVGEAIQQATEDSKKIFEPHLDHLTNTIAQLSDDIDGALSVPLAMVIAKLDTVIKIGDDISKVYKYYHFREPFADTLQVHPYAHVAWKLLTLVYHV